MVAAAVSAAAPAEAVVVATAEAAVAEVEAVVVATAARAARATESTPRPGESAGPGFRRLSAVPWCPEDIQYG